MQQQCRHLRDRLRGTPQATVEHWRQLAAELIPTLPQAFGNPDAAVGHTRTDGTMCGYRSGFLVDAVYNHRPPSHFFEAEHRCICQVLGMPF